MINHVVLREKTIQPALDSLGLYAVEREELLVLTAAAETLLGDLGRRQRGGGPALGLYQMEPATYYDLHDNFLKYSRKLSKLLGDWHDPEHMVGNDVYATKIAALQYYRFSEPIPQGSIEDLARYWKQYWNTSKGAGTEQGAIDKYYYCLAQGSKTPTGA
jgi:hypothetical protein